MNKYEKLFTPIRIGNRILKNRIEAAPAALSNLTPEGYFTDQNIATFERKAKGGPAIVNMGEARIDLKTGISHKLCLALDDDGVLPSLLMATDAIKRHNAIPAVELIHPGGRTNPEYYDGTIWAPSAHKGHLGKDYTELDEETINYIVERFGDAAEMAMYGGVEMIMIHGGHGWLIHEFLSPLHNQRTDKFGGSLENRARFALMVIENIRKKCPNLIIEFRMSGTEYVEGGLTIEDQVEFAKLIDGKVDLIHVSSGSFHYPETNQKMFPNMFMPHGCNVQYAEAIKKVVKTPVATVGGLGDPDLMEEIIESGKADIVCLARPLLADAELPNKIRSGHADDITPCQRCNACISESFVPYVKYCSRIIRCTVNPTKLIPPLLDAVDAGTLKFVPAADFLSHLSEKEQTYLLLVMERDEVSPSLGQAQRLKQLSGEEKLENNIIDLIMREEKPLERKVTIRNDRLQKYFPASYTPKQMEDVIIKLLEGWHRKRQQEMSR